MERVELIVHGRVQGVFFRQFVTDTARRLNLRGYTRNLGDGTVEVVAEGDIIKLQQLVEKCEQGSNASAVEKVKVTFSKGSQEFSGFNAKY